VEVIKQGNCTSSHAWRFQEFSGVTSYGALGAKYGTFSFL